MTAAEELILTDAAITACLTAQSYTVSGRVKMMANYSALTKRRDELLRQVDEASESGGSMCSLGLLMEPSL